MHTLVYIHRYLLLKYNIQPFLMYSYINKCLHTWWHAYTVYIRFVVGFRLPYRSYRTNNNNLLAHVKMLISYIVQITYMHTTTINIFWICTLMHKFIKYNMFPNNGDFLWINLIKYFIFTWTSIFTICLFPISLRILLTYYDNFEFAQHLWIAV